VKNFLSVLLLFFQFLIGEFLMAQTSFQIDYEILKDKNYSFEEVSNKLFSNFKKKDSLELGKKNVYWLKINCKLIDLESGEFCLLIYPTTDLLLHYYKDGKLIKDKTGFEISNNTRHNFLYCFLEKDSINTLYVKLDLKNFGNNGQFYIPMIKFIPKNKIEEKEQLLKITWIVSLIIILIYIINIFLDYIILKDVTNIYYIVILISASIYITTFHRFTRLLIDFNEVRYDVVSNSTYYFLEFNDVLNYTSLIFLIYGYIKMSKKFLIISFEFQFWRKSLNFLFFTYVFISVFCIVSTYFFEFYLGKIISVVNNIFLILILVNIIILGFLSYKIDKLKAKIFLLANLLTFVIIIIIALILIFNNHDSYQMFYLPFIGVLTFVISFAIAITIRNKYIRMDLEKAKLISKTLEIENEKIQLKLDFQHREMVSNSLNISQKNEMLNQLKKEIERIKNTEVNSNHESLNNLQSIIHNNYVSESNWENFKIHFEQVHPNFFKELKQNYPNLTQNELRLSAYLHLNLSNKEIAAIQNIDPDSVKKAKMRLKKKMNSE
jgi:hypothetical protein